MAQLTLFSDAVGEVSNLGWTIPRDIDQETWRNAGSMLIKLDHASQWWKGDWWNAGVSWGEGESVCQELGLSYQTLADCGMVAKAFQFSRRRENLPFTHHREVLAVKDTVIQDRFLAWCEEPLAEGKKHRSRQELRDQIKAYLDDQSWPEAQRERRGLIEAGASVVANLKTDEKLIQWAEFRGLLVRIDRQTRWGNPFELPHDGDRDFVVESYRQYFKRKLSLHKQITDLEGRVLACWCFPEPCHGDVLLDWIAQQSEGEVG